MPKALVFHPHLDLWAGGEYIALLACDALLKKGYDVSVACERRDVEGAERAWQMGEVLERTSHVQLPRLPFDRMRSLQRIVFVGEVRDAISELGPDVVFNTQLSTYLMPETNTIDFVYHPGDLLYYWGNGHGKRELYYSFIRKARGMF